MIFFKRVVINKTDKTAVILTYPGIGDIVWHLPFLHALAKVSSYKQIYLYTRSTTLAKDILKYDKKIAKVFYLSETREFLNTIINFCAYKTFKIVFKHNLCLPFWHFATFPWKMCFSLKTKSTILLILNIKERRIQSYAKMKSNYLLFNEGRGDINIENNGQHSDFFWMFNSEYPYSIAHKSYGPGLI